MRPKYILRINQTLYITFKRWCLSWRNWNIDKNIWNIPLTNLMVILGVKFQSIYRTAIKLLQVSANPSIKVHPNLCNIMASVFHKRKNLDGIYLGDSRPVEPATWKKISKWNYGNKKRKTSSAHHKNDTQIWKTRRNIAQDVSAQHKRAWWQQPEKWKNRSKGLSRAAKTETQSGVWNLLEWKTDIFVFINFMWKSNINFQYSGIRYLK